MGRDISKIESVDVLLELQKEIVYEMVSEDNATKRIELLHKYTIIADRIDILNIRYRFKNIGR